MKTKKDISSPALARRRFLVRSGLAVGAFTIVPRHVLGGPAGAAPNSKLNIAVIGAGGRGAEDLKELQTENIVALCDVDLERAAPTLKRFPKAVQYRDFRVMLEKEKSIDAVLVATPDHTHAVASMAAI